VARNRQAGGCEGGILRREPGADGRPEPTARENHHHTKTPPRHQLISCPDRRTLDCSSRSPEIRLIPNCPAPLSPLQRPGFLRGSCLGPAISLERTVTKTRPKPSDCFLREHREPKETPGPRGNGSVEQAG